MKTKEIIKKAERLARRNQKLRADRRTQRVITLLSAKGLLFDRSIQVKTSTKISIKDALWVGKNVEPRVLEVLPAAVLHFPSSFSDLEKTPKDFAKLLQCLKQNASNGPDFENISYQAFQRWADFRLRDKRVKPQCEKKITTSFRLHPDALAVLVERASKQGISRTECLERLILDASPVAK